jgi:hypothetical protein
MCLVRRNLYILRTYYGLFGASFSRRPEFISQAWGIYGSDTSSGKIADAVESELLRASP